MITISTNTRKIKAEGEKLDDKTLLIVNGIEDKESSFNKSIRS